MSAGKKRVALEMLTMLFGTLMAFLAAGCGSSMEIPSSWTNTPVAVGDSSLDWYGTLTQIKDTRVSLGVVNDTNYAYLCLVAPRDQFRREIMAPGLTLWFDSENGQKLGIHYPMGFANQPHSEVGNGDTEPEQRGQVLQQVLSELEIFGPGKNDRNLLSTAELRGIKVKVGDVGNETVYQLRVPLHQSHDQPYAVGVNPGSTMKVEIESGKRQAHRPEGMREGGEGRRGGGMRGGRGEGGYGGSMGGGHRGGGEGSFGGNRRTQLDETVKVQLAGGASNVH